MGTLISGPPAAGKSQRARELLAASPRGVIVEFQPIYAMLAGQERSPATGRYPPRPEERAYLLRLAEYTRRAAITGAVADGLDVIATQTSGDPARRAFLLSLLPEGSIEEVLDPTRSVVESRLTVDGAPLSDPCKRAVEGWYGAQRSAETISVEVRQEASELVGVVIAEGPGGLRWAPRGLVSRGSRMGAGGDRHFSPPIVGGRS